MRRKDSANEENDWEGQGDWGKGDKDDGEVRRWTSETRKGGAKGLSG